MSHIGQIAPEHTRKAVSLKELLRWAYGRQQVDIVTGTELAPPADELAASMISDSALRTMMTGALGVRIGCLWPGRLDVHPDAEKLHQIVRSLPVVDALLLVEYGRTGMHPDPAEHVPYPSPVAPNMHVETGTGEHRQRGDRCSWAVIDGRRTLYRIDVVEVVNEEKVVYRRAGRGRMVPSHTETVRTEVEWCPVDWWPDPEYWRAVNDIHARWTGILDELRKRLIEIEFRDHSVNDLLINA